MSRLAFCLLLLLAAFPGPATLAAEPDALGNVYMTGPDVRIESPVGGDLVVAAGRIAVDQRVLGDAILGGGSIDIRAPIGDDLRAAGGIFHLSSVVDGEALIAAGSIAFGPSAEIKGRARLAGNDVVVAGRFGAGLSVWSRHVLVFGDIQGPVQISGDQIEIMPSARIFGDVTYSSPHDITVHPGAVIQGAVTRSQSALDIPKPKVHIPGLPALKPLLMFGLLAAGMLLLAVFPNFTVASADMLRTSALKSLGMGTAILFSLPPVIMLLIITIIGIPVALALMAGYAIALLAGYLVAAFCIGDRLLRAVGKASPTFAWRSGGLAAALLLLWLVRAIPYAGGLFILIVLILGLGAMILHIFSHYSTRQKIV